MQSAFEAEVKIAKARLEGMKLVIGDSSDQLEVFKKKYESKLGDGVSTAGKRGTDDVVAAPPCHLLKDLRLLKDIKTEMEDKIVAATSADDLKAAKAEQKDLLAAANSLGTALKSATSELKKAMDLCQKGKLGHASAKAGAKRQKLEQLQTPEKRKTDVPDIYETAYAHGQNLSSKCKDALEGPSAPVTPDELLTPALIVNKSVVEKVLKSDGRLRTSVAAWKGAKWSSSVHRLQSGRAADSIQDLPLKSSDFSVVVLR